eukprot:g1013.t1
MSLTSIFHVILLLHAIAGVQIDPKQKFGRAEGGEVALTDAASDPEDYPDVPQLEKDLAQLLRINMKQSKQNRETQKLIQHLDATVSSLLKTVQSQTSGTASPTTASEDRGALAGVSAGAKTQAPSADAVVMKPKESVVKSGLTAAGLRAAQQAIKSVHARLLQRYGNDFDRMVTLGTWSAPGGEAAVESAMVRALRAGGKFVFGIMGGSLTAGHDDYFKDSWPFKMGDMLREPFKHAGLELVVRNHAMGNTGSAPNSFCMAQMIGAENNIVHWEYMMNDAGMQGNPKEVFLRNAWGAKQSKQPPVMLVFADVPRDPRDKPLSTIKPHKKPPPSGDAGFFRGAERWLDQPEELGKHYQGLGLHAMSVARATWFHDHEQKFSFPYFNHADKPFKDIDAGWHAGPHGHAFRGHVIAAYYLRRFEKALASLSAEVSELPAGMALPPGAPFVPKPLPPVRSCEKVVCTSPAHCAFSFEPKLRGDLGAIMLNNTAGREGSWKWMLSPSDQHAVAKSQAKGLGYLDLKYVFRGDSNAGWLVLQAKDAKAGPLVLCEPNMGWQRPKADVPLSATDAVDIELDGNAVRQLPPQDLAIFNSIEQEGPGGKVPLCTIVAHKLSPGDHTIALRVTKPGVYAVVSHLIWW